MPRQTIGNPAIVGETIDEIRQSTQWWMQQIVNAVDELSGLRGTPVFHADVNLNNRRLTNVGTPQLPSDAVPEGLALTKVVDPISGATQWNAENLQILNVQAAQALEQGVNLAQLRQELADAMAGTLPRGSIIMWAGSLADIPAGWQLCDGTNSSPDLRDRFVMGAGTTYVVNATGGAATINIAHTHTADGTLAAASAGAHTHGDGTYATGAPSGTTTVDNDLALSTVAVASATHTHDVTGASASDGAHTHDVTGDTSSALSAAQSVLNPFLALAYIYKL